MKSKAKLLALTMAFSLAATSYIPVGAAESENISDDISATEQLDSDNRLDESADTGIEENTSKDTKNNVELEQKPMESALDGEAVIDDDPGTGRYEGYVSEGFYDGISTYSFQAEDYSHNSRFDDYTIKKGIDVSSHNGTIDWTSVKNDGIEFAIIRGAYRGYGSSGSLNTDTMAADNMNAAVAAGIPIGAYIFSQAITEEEAVAEAEYLLDIVDGYDITLPLVFDFEYASDSNGLTGRLYNANLTADEATAICLAFCETVENAGYTAMVYANKSMLRDDLNASEISKDYAIWLANYTNKTDYEGDYEFWQCTDQGSVSGISGNVDLDFWYVEPETDDGKELIEQNGEWLYYSEGVWQEDFTGLEKIDGTWYYISSGVWQSGYTGVVTYSSGSQYYVKDGIIQHGFTGLIKLGNTWYYIVGGRWQSGYTGLATYSGGTQYYVEDGIIQHGFTGLIKLESTWYYIVGGRWQSGYTGLVEYSSGSQYYVKDGIIQHGFTGLVKLGAKWYYIVGGRWQLSFTGLAMYRVGSWYYVEHGVIDYSFTGLVKQNTNTYYVNGGRWQKGFSGSVIIEGVRYTISNGLVV